VPALQAGEISVKVKRTSNSAALSARRSGCEGSAACLLKDIPA